MTRIHIMDKKNRTFCSTSARVQDFCECCGTLSAKPFGSAVIFSDGPRNFTLRNNSNTWFEFTDKQAASHWVYTLLASAKSTVTLEDFTIQTWQEYEEARKISLASQSNRSYIRDECIRVWKLIKKAPQFPTPQEMDVLNISSAREWALFKNWFDKTQGGQYAPDIL